MDFKTCKVCSVTKPIGDMWLRNGIMVNNGDGTWSDTSHWLCEYCAFHR